MTLQRVIGIVGKISNGVLSVCAGVSSFIFTLLGYVLVSDFDGQLVASLFIGLFALLVVWVASEKPNSSQARAVAALVDRLLAVGTGDLKSPPPAILREQMPALASAVEGLFEQVRSNLDNVHAMAMYDPVTSLPNRVHFKREAERILKARLRDDKLALLFIDLDGFKEVNDSLGHAQGDHTLALVASRLRAVVKDEVRCGAVTHPLIARLAGDEFTLLFSSVAGPEQAEQISRRVLAALCEDFAIGEQTVKLGASIGVALCPQHGGDLPGLMKAADVAMYHAKASGRSQVCVYDAALAAALAHKARIERELRHAVARSEFALVFHPQVCARSGAVVAGEALIRWHHPRDGTLLPESFIAIAEESNLIAEIGDWVVDEAAHVAARWHAAGMAQRVTINISPKQLERSDFFARLRHGLAQAGAPASMVELEFTETLAMRCGDDLLREIAEAQAAGISIAIDDFGSGYSNLARMKDMPINRVKLDSSLTRDLDSCENGRTIVSSVIHLVHGLGAEVVAEGVERREQIDVLRALGCDLIQGYAFAMPMGEEDFLDWLGTRSGQPRRVLTG
ncbi:MAG: putative bifunctional diguanylate cyclase/phosphodiesterase [Sphingomonadales bacterium]